MSKNLLDYIYYDTLIEVQKIINAYLALIIFKYILQLLADAAVR